MTDTSTQGIKKPLGVGAIIAESFSIFLSNFPQVFILGFLGSLFGLFVNILALGFDVATGAGDFEAISPNISIVGYIASLAINVVVYGIVTATIIQLAYDSKLGRIGSLRTYISTALPAIIPIAVLSIVIGLLSTIGALALLVGAFWVYAVFYVMAPVAVIERGGFGSMGRSASLTKEYRWPIVGVLLLLMVFSIAAQFVGSLLVPMLAGLAGQIGAGIGLAAVTALAYGFGGIVVSMVYARLREIKEGVNVDQISNIFE